MEVGCTPSWRVPGIGVLILEDKALLKVAIYLDIRQVLPIIGYLTCPTESGQKERDKLPICSEHIFPIYHHHHCPHAPFSY